MFPHQQHSGNFATWALNPPRTYRSHEITAIICIRAHEGNPWVLDRLAMLGALYQPAPSFQIVDFGSKPEFSTLIRSHCERQGLDYHRVDDSGVFSLSIARNEGVLQATTDLLYFTDIDFVSGPAHFEELARHATEHDFSIIRDIVLNLPAYHLTEKHSAGFDTIAPQDRARHLAQLGALAAERSQGDIVEFIAPYSNNFLCTRDFFTIAGGYDANFRGHGSEDFELMIRFAHHTRSVEFPEDIAMDCQSPARDWFFKPRPYLGFRRLGEAVSFRAESHGFKTFHLWHPTRDGDPWRDCNDWKRDTLRTSLARYLDTPANLASVDHLPRPRKALCVCKDPEHYGYFLPFRALGYQLIVIPDDSDEQITKAERLISSREVDAFLIFNPYMKSHARFLELYQLAAAVGIEAVVVERGALPSTIYYAPDVSYNDPDFLNYDTNPPSPDASALNAADEVCDRVRSGNWTLETLSDYDETRRSYASLAKTKGARVFIPLQLADDMAVTRFVRETQSYADFEAAIGETARRHPDITFVVKAHPLNRDAFAGSAPNVIVCQNQENVHAIIDSCDFTVCYNSGVGLLSLIHGKPTITIGNAFYNVNHTGHRADSLADAVALVASGNCTPPSTEAARRFIAWLITRKYSFFKADDLIREFKHRNSHGYRDIMVTHLNWNGHSLPLGRCSALGSIQANSYINGRLGLGIGTKVTWFDNPKLHARGPVKSFFLNYFKRPYRRLIGRLKSS
jgi:predicted glycosyltransferase involved in capsule biosynthesis